MRAISPDSRRLSRVEVGAQVHALPHAHFFELLIAVRDGVVHDGAQQGADTPPASGSVSRMLSACGRRSKIAGRQLPARPDRGCAPASMAAANAWANSSFSSTCRRRALAQLQRQPTLRRGRAPGVSARSRASCGSRSAIDRRQPHLQVEEPVVHRPDRHAQCAALVVAGQRRKAGHALDHREVSAFWPCTVGRLVPRSTAFSVAAIGLGFEQLHLVQARIGCRSDGRSARRACRFRRCGRARGR